MTETRPQVTEEAEVTATSAESTFLGTGNHVSIGRSWITAGTLVLLISLVVGALSAFEHSDLGGFDLVNNSNTFIQIWSAGRVLLLLGGIIPIFVGIATAVVPLQVGSPGLAFSRGAAAAFWTWLLSIGVVVMAYVFDGGPAGNTGDMVVLWALALSTAAAALIWSMVCIVATVLGSRAKGMTLDRVPITSWGFLVFGVMGLVILPVTIAELVLGYLDTKYGYLPSADARRVLIGPLNTLSFTPAVFWASVPALAMGLEAVGVHTGRVNKGHRVSLVLLAVVGFIGFGSDTFSFGSRGRVFSLDNGVVVVATLALMAPIALLILAGMSSIRAGKIKMSAPLIAGVSSMMLLLLASAVAAVAQIEPLVGFLNTNFDASINLASELSLNGTSYHDGLRVLVLGACALGAVGGVHHFAHKLWGRALNPAAGFLTMAAMVGGVILWGAGYIVAGFLGQVALPAVEAASNDGIEPLNMVSTIGAALMAAGVGVFLLDLIGSLWAGKGSSVEPWSGLTLEWATNSPPDTGNFESAPVVTSATPLAETSEGEEA